MKKTSKKSLSLASKLRRNLRMGKICIVEFLKVEDNTITRRRVKALSSGDTKGTGQKPKTGIVCFFDLKIQAIRCCRTENILSVQTEAQKMRANMRRARYEKAVEVAGFYDISIKDAWAIVLDKIQLKSYESERQEDYYLSGEYLFDLADAKH